jgi:glucose dehydrogenase
MALAAGIVLAQEPIDKAALLRSPNTEWLTYGGDYAETHYSPLDQINDANVSRLGLAWQWDIGGTAGGTQEATLLVRDGVIYATGTWSNVFALDARTGKLRWLWDPAIVQGNGGDDGPSFCLYPGSRGLAMYGNKVYAGNLVFRAGNQRFYAHDARTGKILWSVFVGGQTATPVTYELDGRQYIAVAVSPTRESPALPARFLAFALDGNPIQEPPPR